MESLPSWARPGVEVVCVKEFYPREWLKEIGPTVGQKYTIREAIIDDGEACIRLVEIVNPVNLYEDGYSEGTFVVEHFQPLIRKTQEQDVALFAPLLNIKKIEENV